MTLQRYKAGIGGYKTVWPIVVPDVKGSLVYFADHERTVAGLCEVLRMARMYVEWCAKRDGWIGKPDTDLQAIDALLAEHAETKGE